MRKTIAIVLSVLMVVSLLCLGVSAAEGTPVKTAEEFAAMTADGTYYLDADLKIDVSYADTFTGVLDGNGHTVTVSVPMFTLLSGTVKNLILNGEVKSKDHAGALAGSGNGVTVINVVNNANVSSTKDSAYVGGLIGAMTTGSGTATAFQQSTFTDCVNNGTIHAGAKTPRVGGIVGNNAKHQFTTFTGCINNGKIDVTQDEGFTSLTGASYTAGICAGIFHGKFVNCVNYGDIFATLTSDMGGIAGRLVPSTQEADHTITFINCSNYGNLTDHGRANGGIFGYAGVKMTGAAYAVYYVDKCTNYGTISNADGGEAGGLAGYVYGQAVTEGSTIFQYLVMTDSVNYGTAIGKAETEGKACAWASQFIGYTNARSTVIKNCVGLGKVEADDPTRAVVVGLSSDDSTLYQISGTKLLENDGTKQYSYAADSTDNANDHNRIALADRPAGMIDIVSKADAEKAAAALGEIGYVAPAAPEQPETPDVPDVPATGDTLAVVAAVAALAVLGMAVAIRKKED